MMEQSHTLNFSQSISCNFMPFGCMHVSSNAVSCESLTDDTKSGASGLCSACSIGRIDLWVFVHTASERACP